MRDRALTSVGAFLAAAALCLAVSAAGASAPTARQAAPDPFFGVVGVHYPSQAELDRAARAGAGIFRFQLPWGFIEPTPGARVYNDLDRLVAMAANAGITLLPDLIGVPGWISKNPNRPPIHTATERAAWQSLLGDFARRYGSNGTFWTLHPELTRDPITTWEIWNEPNLGGFFGGKPNARGFAQLLSISSSGLREADPAAHVLTGGIFPYHTLPNTVDMVHYLKALYRIPGVASDFDALGLHPYSTSPRTVLHWVRVARRIMRNHGDAGTPIWISEFGWVTGGRRLKYSPLRSTLRQQAGRLTRAYHLFERNASRLGIAAALWFSYTDHDTPGGPDFWTDRAGLFRLNGSPKPAWFAFARVAGGSPG
jgi:hypothetical protein